MITTKCCTFCNVEKDFSEFHKESKGKYGLASICKLCKKEKSKKYYAENREKISENYKARYYNDIEKFRSQSRERQTKYRNKDKEAYKVRDSTWRRENRDKCRIYETKFKSKNAHRVRSWHKRYRDRLLQNKPKWANSELYDFMFEEIYALRDLRNEISSFKWNVDHIVPLLASSSRHNQVACGLHVPWNLAVIPASENFSKNAYKWPDSWEYV